MVQRLAQLAQLARRGLVGAGLQMPVGHGHGVVAQADDGVQLGPDLRVGLPLAAQGQPRGHEAQQRREQRHGRGLGPGHRGHRHGNRHAALIVGQLLTDERVPIIPGAPVPPEIALGGLQGAVVDVLPDAGQPVLPGEAAGLPVPVLQPDDPAGGRNDPRRVLQRTRRVLLRQTHEIFQLRDDLILCGGAHL